MSFLDDLQHCIDKIKNTDFTKIILTGDLNADPSTNNGKKLIDVCAENCFTMHINQPTRITETTSSCLDQIITNIPNFVRSTNISAPLTNCDHCTASANLLFRRKRPRHLKDKTVWDYNKADYDIFRGKLS